MWGNLTVNNASGASGSMNGDITASGGIFTAGNIIKSINSSTNSPFIIQSGGDDETRFLNSSGNWGYISCRTVACTGGKPALVETESYGETYLWAEESPTPVFSDHGHGVIGDSGLCYLMFDDKFAETVSTKQCDYYIKLTGYTGCNAEIYDKQADHFVVSGAPGKKFDWTITAERKGYERLRFNECMLDI
jgi:hypothetical protein